MTQTSIDDAGRGDNSYAVPSPTEFKIALVQMRCSTDPADNLARAIERIRSRRQGWRQAGLPAGAVPQPVLLSDGGPRQLRSQPSRSPGPAPRRWRRSPREAGVVVIGSLFERRAAGVYHNTAVILDADGKHLGSYRKMHIPDDPAYYEKFYFTPGDLGFRAFDTAVGRIGTLVCWDQWYPEGARLTALAGADVLFYPTAIGWHPDEKAEFGAAQASAWQTAQRAHAIANGVYVAAVNRVGLEKPPAGTPGKGIEFWGGSFVADPFGVMLAEASRTDEETLIVTCNRKHQETVRQHWPFLRDRRIDAYAGVTRRLIDE